MHNLRILYRLISPRRRRQLFLTLAAMLIGTFAELVTIGAALSFLVLLSGVGNVPPPLAGWLAAGGVVTVTGAALFLIAGAVVAAAVRLLLTWLNQSFVAALGMDMATRIYSRTLRQPYADFVRQNSSEVIAGVGKVQMLVSGLLQPAMQGVIALVIGLAIAIFLFVIDPLIAAILAVSISAAYGLVSLVTHERLRRNSRSISQAATARTKIVQEGIGGIRDIILDQSQPVFEEQFSRAESRFWHAQTVTIFIAAVPRFIIEAAGIIALALVALIMSREPGGLMRAVPVIGALALGAQRLLPLLQQSYRGLTQTLGNLQALYDVIRLMEQPPATSLPRSPITPEQTFRDKIVFDAVGFQYPGAGFALRDVSLSIDCGSRVGVRGTTGGGKSTLLDLLMGLLDPTSGEIRIDGWRLDDASRSIWQAQIAHVPQAIYLSDDSIAANIAFGAREGSIDPGRVRSAAEAACLAPFIDTLPEGYETRVGERGIRLSGGQRQRIGIARALYKGARVLILDEATSALDDETEARVMESLMAMGSAVTLIMVAHRTSTLAACDQILRVEGGRLI